MPGGAEYWAEQQRWIRTGVDPEYEVAYWAPFQSLFLVGAFVVGWLSLSLIPLTRGFYEVDLMNFYVGRLLAGSSEVGPALALGWHPWSVARGVCYTLLLADVAHASLARSAGTPGAAAGWRARVGVALGFFVLDMALKLALLETVRARLAAGLGG
jgi:hypothetical protein